MVTWLPSQGLRVLPDGTWRTGEAPVAHDNSLAYFKAHLVFEDGGAFVLAEGQRMPVAIEGPAFEVVALVLDPQRGIARVILDDGTGEMVADDSLGMNEATGRLECAVKGGRARALFSRAAHQTLLEYVEQDAAGHFTLRVGRRQIAIRS